MVFKISNVKELIIKNQEESVTQSEFVKNYTASLYANQKLIESNGEDVIKYLHAIVLNGSDGTGKTYLASKIASSFGVPVKAINYRDCTMDSLSDVALKLLEDANWDFDLAERGIVIIDDVDEKNNKDADQNKSILSFVNDKIYVNIELDTKDGKKVRAFDTSKLTYVLITNYKRTRRAIGFGDREDIELSDDGIDLLRKITIPVTTVDTQDLSIEDYKKFLLESERSPLRELTAYLKSLGEKKKILYTSKFVDSLIKKAYQKKNGIKGLIMVFSEVKDDIITKIITSDETEIVIDENIFDKAPISKK